MKKNNYWQNRFLYLEKKQHDKNYLLYDAIEQKFNIAQQEIQKEINNWYYRFAQNNELSMQEARKLLNNQELKELHWDIKTYIKKGEENNISGQWLKELENASAKYHISRLEALKLHTQQSLEVLYGDHLDLTDKLIRDGYEQRYYRTLYEVQKGFKTGWPVAAIDNRKLEKILHKPWTTDGNIFSDRIWHNKDKLVNELHQQLTQMCILNKGPNNAIENIAKKINTAKNNAGRLIMTESAFFSSTAQKDAFNDLGVEKFKIVVTLDKVTSEICQKLDGHVEEMKNYQPGVTAPPFHVWCRSITIPYFDDMTGERIARGANGKTQYIPAAMKYDEWKAKFLNLNSKENTSIMKEEWDGLNYTSTYTKEQAIEKLKRTYKIIFEDSHKYPINGELLSDCVGWLDSFAAQYPDFINKNPCCIPVISNKAPNKMKNAIGYYSYYSNSPKVAELALNGLYHSAPGLFKNYVEKAISTKWYPENASIHKTFIHEFGHHVSNSMRWLKNDPQWQHNFIQQCINDYNALCGKDIKGFEEFKDIVSEYACTNESELFAETFAEFFGGTKPRSFALIFGNKLEHILKEV